MRFLPLLSATGSILVAVVAALKPVELPITAIPFGPEVPDPPAVISAPVVPRLGDFVAQVWDGNATRVAGVYAYPLFALPVVSQSPNNPAEVISLPGRVTQFGLAAHYGTLGFLAHYEFAGAAFFQLRLGQSVAVVYGDGRSVGYTITGIRRVQALEPESPYSNFVDLPAVQGDAPVLSSTELFNQVYAAGPRVVFQTCIPLDGVPSWGRLFVIATQP